MANDNNDGLRGRDLQESQSGGDSGEFGGNQAQQQQADPAGGGVTASDQNNAGGSSGTGGYGGSQDIVNARDGQPEQGSQSGLAEGDLRAGGGSSDGQDQQASGQSRGERFDEEQGGGRAVMFDGSGGVSDFADDQAAHQDRGQSEAADFEKEG